MAGLTKYNPYVGLFTKNSFIKKLKKHNSSVKLFAKNFFNNIENNNPIKEKKENLEKEITLSEVSRNKILKEFSGLD
jgi:heme oxygenase